MTTAVLDACVLYSALLRDLFMRMTACFVFQPKWTEHIHEEWMRNVLENRPDLQREALERTRRLMDAWGKDWQADDYETRIESLTLPDANDRHVLAAAIASGATLIVTFNLKDFPARALAPYKIRALHPDKFLCELLNDAPAPFLEAIKAHRAALKSPSKTAEEYLDGLKRSGLPMLAKALEERRDTI